MSVSATPSPSPGRLTLAWGVHLLTASGAVFGALALLFIGAGDFTRALWLMFLNFIIDSLDGTLARRVGVEHLLPAIDGRRLDDMVDYLNYVIVPAVFMVAAGSLLGWGWAALPILASAYGFSREDAKTDDDFFLGFPSYWNILAMYLWMLDISPLGGTLWVVGFTVAVFIPLKYIYPSHSPVLRRATTLFGLAWGISLIVALLVPGVGARFRLVELSLVYPAYYMALSFWVGGLQRGTRLRE